LLRLHDAGLGEFQAGEEARYLVPVAQRSPGRPAPASAAYAGVATTSADGAWAVGATWTEGDAEFDQSLVAHWNGRSWRRVPSP
jgi:hypothetical protein